MDKKQWLSTLDMLPVSEAMFAKKFHDSNASIDWILYDVYKVAPDFPLQVSTYGYIFNASTNINSNPIDLRAGARLQTTDKFRSKSVRDDLQGLQLTCGKAVKRHFISFISGWN